MNKFQNYLAIEDLGGPHFHPSKNKIVFTYNSSGEYHIYETDIKKGNANWPIRLTYSQNRCTSGKYLSDGTVVFTSDEGGNENFQIGLIDKREQYMISDDPDAKYNINMHSSEYLFYASNTDDKSKFCIYKHKLPLRENSPVKVFTPEIGTVSVSAINEDESTIIISNARSNTQTELYSVDLNTLEYKHLTADFSPAVWIPVRLKNNELIVICNYNNDYKRPGKLNLNDLSFSSYAEFDEMRVEFVSFTYSKNADNIYMLINKDGYSELIDCNLDDNVSFTVLQLPRKGVIGSGDQRSFTRSMSVNHDNSMIAFNFSSPSRPSNIFVIDVKEGAGWQVTKSAAPGISSSNFSDATLHSFISFDGMKVPYFMYLPKTEVPANGYPTIIMIHGGPEAQFRPGFSPVIQFYLSAGFAIVAPNIRGSAGYGRKYMDLDNKDRRLDSILDIKYLALHVREESSIDGDNLIIYGGSYGGFAVLSAMTEHAELWKAGVDIVGISNFVTFLQNTAAWRRKLRESEYGSLDEDIDMLRSISPIHKIDNIRSPLFIIQGDRDERVPLSESIQMYEQLNAKGLNVELLRFADEGHGVAKLKNKIIAYPRVLEWLLNIIEN